MRIKGSDMPSTLRILVVDDEELVRSAIADSLEGEVEEVWQCDSVPNALFCLAQHRADIIVCDLHMPEVHGLELIRKLREQQSDAAFIVMTGKPELNDVVSALRLRAAGFLAKPFSKMQLLEALGTAFEELSAKRQLALRAAALSSQIQEQSSKLREALSQLQITERSSLEALVVALDAREHETCAHSFRVRAYTSHLARNVNYPAAEMTELEIASPLHDVGKIAVPDSILLKPGPLTEEEVERCKKHSVAGALILDSIPSLLGAAKIVRHHHEHWDGRGYPDQLKGEEIPLGARLFTVADTLDALLSDRCYRSATSWANARVEILRCSSTQFDPAVVEAFLRIPEQEWLQLRIEADRESLCIAGGRGHANLFANLVSEVAFVTPDAL